MEKLFLIDGHALCYRSFYAIRELTASNGQATNAVFGFVNAIRKIIREFDPKYLAVCFDSKEKTHRAKKYSEYKIQRPKMPEDLISQIPIIKEVLQAYKFPIYELGGYEADDIIATLTDMANKENIEVTIVTEDKDLFQLSNKMTNFFRASKDQILKEADVKDKLGFEPERIIDFIALAGDKADNIPGVVGVGEVTAKRLINEFGELEDIYKNVEQIDKVKVKEKLIDQRDMAFLSKELAVLEKDVPVSFDLEELVVGEPDSDKLYELFKSLEFKRFAQEYAGTKQEEYKVNLKPISNKKEAQALLKLIKTNQVFAYLNSVSTDSLFGEMFIAINKNQVFSLSHDLVEDLKDIWEDENITKVTYNCKEMFKFLEAKEIYSAGETFDVLLAAFLLLPNQSGSNPSELAWTYFQATLSDDALRAKETDVIYRLYDVLRKQLKKNDLLDLYTNIERPLSYVLCRMETNGVCLDEGLLSKLSKKCQKKIDALTIQLYEAAGEEFNINSPKQLGVILFEKLSLPAVKKTKTGYSTDESVLTKLSEMHEVPSLILEYRQLAKLKSTYIDALPKLVNQQTGRIHAEFNQIGAETGRLSSRHPNLQNIPIRTELGRQIRKAIVPSKGNILLAADYSQIELRVLAHLSQDESLLDAFNNDQDIHNYTASLIFDVEQKDVDYTMRDTAKRVNFGIVYGMSGFGLSKDLGITQKEAQEFIERYFTRYPKVKEFMDKQIDICQTEGFVLTILNRRRYIPDINSKNNGIRQFAERQAINTPVQGSAADLMKLAMINVQNEMEKQKLKSDMIITVHDELVFDLHPKEEKTMLALVKTTMEDSIKLDIPVKVDIKKGGNWLDMEEVIV